jgi:hypothetical protein
LGLIFSIALHFLGLDFIHGIHPNSRRTHAQSEKHRFGFATASIGGDYGFVWFGQIFFGV